MVGDLTICGDCCIVPPQSTEPLEFSLVSNFKPGEQSSLGLSDVASSSSSSLSVVVVAKTEGGIVVILW